MGIALLEFGATNAQLLSNYNSPLFPTNFPDIPKTSKKIPQKIWIAVKNQNDVLPSHIQEFFQINNNWVVSVCDNSCKDVFMNTVFAGTSVQWAYNMINPLLGAAKADIWRYSVLYTFGGIYIDDDSFIRTPLDEVVSETDNLILAEEGASSLGDCYYSGYHLSDSFVLRHYGSNMSTVPYFHGVNADNGHPLFFHGNTLVNWAILTMPRHPLFKSMLANIVEVVTSDYNRNSIVMLTKWDVKFKALLCTTNFIMTYTLREMLLQGLPAEFMPRICGHDFKEYKGKAKQISTAADASHYRKTSQNLLKEHLIPAPSLEETISFLEGQLVNSDASGAAGRSIYLVQNGSRHSFDDFNTFLNMGFRTTQVRVLTDKLIQSIPLGTPMPTVATPIDTQKQIVLMSSKASKDGAKKRSRSKENNQSSILVAASTSTTPLGSSTSSGQSSNSGNHTGPRGTHHRRHHKHHGAPALSHVDPISALIEQTPGLIQNYTLLQTIASRIEAQNMSCYKDDYAGTRDEFLRGRWSAEIEGHPVLVYPLCLNTFQLGNTLGYYFNDLACAELAGVHYIGVHKNFQIQDPSALSTPPSKHHSFLEAFPSIVPHPRAGSMQEAKDNVKRVCKCIRYCWENNESPWLRIVESISHYMLHAIDTYIDVADIGQGTVLSNVTDLIYFPPGSASSPQSAVGISTESHPYLPLIPDVTVQYRCGDNVGFGKTRYGLLPFPAIVSRIYPSAKHIYVIADSPSRSAGHPYNSRCGIILQSLFDILKSNFPNSIIIIKRGGDLFLDVARLAYSNITICSASTFCLWPALANRGRVHFPYTPLIAGGWTNLSLPDFGPHFHWIREVEILKEFKQFKPWHKVLDVLKTLTFTE